MEPCSGSFEFIFEISLSGAIPCNIQQQLFSLDADGGSADEVGGAPQVGPGLVGLPFPHQQYSEGELSELRVRAQGGGSPSSCSRTPRIADFGVRLREVRPGHRVGRISFQHQIELFPERLPW